jgi:DNA-binding CsgD family transcriptional regulator
VTAPSLTEKAQQLADADRLPAMLTARELRVFSMVCDGLQYDEIGAVFHVSKSAVAITVRHVRDKLHARTNMHAAAKLIRAGLI